MDDLARIAKTDYVPTDRKFSLIIPFFLLTDIGFRWYYSSTYPDDGRWGVSLRHRKHQQFELWLLYHWCGRHSKPGTVNGLYFEWLILMFMLYSQAGVLGTLLWWWCVNIQIVNIVILANVGASVQAILFLAPLSFDQVLEEDSRMIRLASFAPSFVYFT